MFLENDSKTFSLEEFEDPFHYIFQHLGDSENVWNPKNTLPINNIFLNQSEMWENIMYDPHNNFEADQDKIEGIYDNFGAKIPQHTTFCSNKDAGLASSDIESSMKKSCNDVFVPEISMEGNSKF